MLTPFAKAFESNEPGEPNVPEVVPIDELTGERIDDELTGERIEAAEAEIEAEEQWPRTV